MANKGCRRSYIFLGLGRLVCNVSPKHLVHVPMGYAAVIVSRPSYRMQNAECAHTTETRVSPRDSQPKCSSVSQGRQADQAILLEEEIGMRALKVALNVSICSATRAMDA